MVDQVASTLKAAGILVLPVEAVKRGVAGPRDIVAAAVLPHDGTNAEAGAARLLDEARPSALLAIEYPGAGRDGLYYSGIGIDISEGVAGAEAVFRLARERALLTISFADMPNEIGLGRLDRGELKNIPHGNVIGSESITDFLVMGATANWAGYATVAALSLILDRPEIRYSRAQEERSIAALQQAGAVEGQSGSLDPAAGVDGIATHISGHVLELLDFSARRWCQRNGGLQAAKAG
jgi:hypothetical protein